MMAKNIRRMLAMIMVLCVCVSAMPLQALAEDGTTYVPSTETSPEGLPTNVLTTTTTITDEGGNTTITVSIDKSTSGTTADGVEIVRTENTTTTTEKQADGSTSEKTTEGGSERKEWTEEVAPGQKVPDVKAESSYETDEDGNIVTDDAGKPVTKKDQDGNTIISGTASSGPVDEGTTGTTPEKNPGKYDYTENTSNTDRTVTGTVSEGKIYEEETNYTAPVAPEDYEGKGHDTEQSHMNNPQANGVMTMPPEYYVKPENADGPPKDENGNEIPGYDFFLSGQGEVTDAAAPVFKKIVYQRDENGDPIPDGNGGYLIDESKSKLINGAQNVAKETGMDYQPAQLLLTYKDGTGFYAYCADYLVETSTDYGYPYNLENLEDSGHYTKEDAEQLRSIVQNAYWGTESGQGSLDSMKTMLENKYGTDGQVTVQDKNGNDVTYTVSELLSGLKEHEALAVSQAAIWAYSINRRESLEGVDKVVVVGAQSAIKCYNSKGGALSEYVPANDQLNSLLTVTRKHSMAELEELGFTAEMLAEREAEALRSDARMKALFDCLMTLEKTPASAEGVTTVVNEDSIADVALVVKDKVQDAQYTDENGQTVESDVYNADLSFTLTFIPEKDTNSMLVYVCDAEGNFLKDKDGKNVVRRLSGENAEGEDYETITPVNGVYTLTGLQLSENIAFDLRLEGTQHLNQGAYLYTAAGGRLASQTLIGLAEGDRSVTAGVTIKFDVDEERNVVAQRIWYDNGDPEVTPGENNPTPQEDNDPAPQVFHLANNDEVETIPEEEVPLAAAPVTGDLSNLWIPVILAAAFGLFILNMIDKKRANASF